MGDQLMFLEEGKAYKILPTAWTLETIHFVAGTPFNLTAAPQWCRIRQLFALPFILIVLLGTACGRCRSNLLRGVGLPEDHLFLGVLASAEEDLWQPTVHSGQRKCARVEEGLVVLLLLLLLLWCLSPPAIYKRLKITP